MYSDSGGCTGNGGCTGKGGCTVKLGDVQGWVDVQESLQTCKGGCTLTIMITNYNRKIKLSL